MNYGLHAGEACVSITALIHVRVMEKAMHGNIIVLGLLLLSFCCIECIAVLTIRVIFDNVCLRMNVMCFATRCTNGAGCLQIGAETSVHLGQFASSCDLKAPQCL